MNTKVKIKTSGEHRKTVSTNQHVVRSNTDYVNTCEYNIPAIVSYDMKRVIGWMRMVREAK